ncbi:hypothetical protein [Vibrio harveyi]|uniref:hypothetical protein n=1 Tax=Vibrio harveyi TaxID=669 RepID=UPI003CEFE24D
MNRELDKMPPLIFHNKWFRWILCRDKAVFLSLSFVYYSYFYASVWSSPPLISGSGVMMTVVGLLLTLKHNFVSDSKDLETAFSKYHRKAGFLDYDGELTTPGLVNPVVSAVKDEYVGILLIVLGSLIGAYGDLLPLIGTT